METGIETRRLRLGAALRQQDRVLPLELFFDLVFVLAITQCTALMSRHPTWAGLGEGMLILALLWWSWVAYAWLTSVIDPEEGGVRIALFAAMAGFLIAAICVPDAFGSLATEFAVAYGAVRIAQICLLLIAGRDDPTFRRSVTGLGIGTAVGITLLICGSFLDSGAQAAVWGLALILDMGEPYLFGSEGWHLVPGHFAERHGLIVIIALGESIVAIGLGAGTHLTWGIAAAAVLGIGVVAALWWAYFDIVALVSARRLVRAPEGKVRNELARDSYSYIHFLLVAGIILLALGLKKGLGHPDRRAGGRARLRPGRRRRRLPARPGRIPLAARPHTQQASAGHGGTAVRALSRRPRAVGPGDARPDQRAALVDDRLRDQGIRGGPRRGPPRGSGAGDIGRSRKRRWLR